MRTIAVADCETDPFKIGRVPKPFLWGWFDGTRYKQFESTKAFVKFAREQDCIMFAHNGGKFDWHFVLPELNAYDDLMIINGRIARANLGACECRDSYNIIPVPLAAYEKEKIDYRIMEESERHKPRNWKKICDYMKSDCVNLYELIMKFIALYGLQITQASAAMNQWKKISARKLPQTTKEFYDQFSPYYYGGRVECFESGIIDTKFNVYDINSAYPYAMQHRHPYSGEFVRAERYVPNADFYTVECVSRGAFPYRGEGNPNEFAGLRFPCDRTRRTYFVTGWEYTVACETRTISDVRVKESVTFLDHVDFASYIDHFYQMRLRAKASKDKAEDLFAKLLMNSLYGKFAANPENYRNYMIVPMDTIAGLGQLGWQFAGELGPWALAEAPLEAEQMRYYNVATGASITGFVRAMLWRAIATSNGVMYCDTDSIAVRQQGPAVVLGEKIGQWKYEGTFDKAGIGGKKLYIFRDIKREKKYSCMTHPGEKCEYKHASKGARLTHDELWEVADHGEVRWESMVPTFSVNKAPEFTHRNIKYTADRNGEVTIHRVESPFTIKLKGR